MDIEKRKEYIGGSDCAGVLGLSRWTTPLKIWAVKTGQIVPEDISQKIAVKLGNKLEQTVCELFTEQTGLKVRRVNETLFHKDYNFIGANIDRKIEGQDVILEAKTCSVFKAKEWGEDEIPAEYLLQCYHYLAVTGYKKCWIAVLIGNQDFKFKEVLYDKKVIDDIIRKEVFFWREFVETKTMPTTILSQDSDILNSLFPNIVKSDPVALGDEVDSKIESLQGLQEDFNSLKGTIEKSKNEIKAMLKENESGITPHYKVVWQKIHKDPYEVKEQNYRQLKIYGLKEKGE